MSLGIGLHIMVALAANRGAWVTSSTLASSVGVNPVTIRRVLGKLLKGGLIETQPGPGGGARLVRRAELISVLDVYNVLDRPSFIRAHGCELQECPISKCMPDVFQRLNDTIENRARDVLSETTLQTLLDEEITGL